MIEIHYKYNGIESRGALLEAITYIQDNKLVDMSMAWFEIDMVAYLLCGNTTATAVAVGGGPKHCRRCVAWLLMECFREVVCRRIEYELLRYSERYCIIRL